jgi:hypothetical protein
MGDVKRITEVQIAAKPTEPLTAIMHLRTSDGDVKLEIAEDVAHKICSDLERFLTR